MQSNTYIQNRHHNVGIAGGFPDLRYNSRFNPVVYSGAITGLRISSIDGTAFIDACAALVPYADGSHLVEIYSATGLLRGYLAAAGDGEDLGDELINTVTNLSNSYETLTINANGRDIDSAINDAGGAGVAYTNDTISIEKLYKIVADITLNSGTAPQLRAGANNAGYIDTATLSGALVDGTYYYTAAIFGGTRVPEVLTLRMASEATNFSLVWSQKQVTAPSADGCTIVSAKGGATANFAYKDASFSYNASSYQIVVRAAR
jgi:hypothetical protein